MNQTIEQLWNGTLRPLQNCGCNDPELDILMNLIQRNRENHLQSLDTAQRETFSKYVACTEEYAYLLSAHAFQDGFSLGTKLLSATLSK